MTKSIVFATLLAVALAACAQKPVEQPAAAPPPEAPVVSGLVAYCGQIWAVGKQGYLDVPCPPDSNYPGGGPGVR